MAMARTMRTERAGKIQMGKIERAYKAKEREAGASMWDEQGRRRMRDSELARTKALEVEARALYQQMLDLRESAKALGFSVSCDTLRYNESPTRALISANID